MSRELAKRIRAWLYNREPWTDKNDDDDEDDVQYLMRFKHYSCIYTWFFDVLAQAEHFKLSRKDVSEAGEILEELYKLEGKGK